MLLLLLPMALFAQVEVDTVIHLPSLVVNGCFITELNKLYVYGWYEHMVLDCSTYQMRARIPRMYSQSYGYYSWNWLRQKLYIGSNGGADSVTVFDAVADTVMRMIPRVGDAGVYVGSTDRFYRPLAHIGLVGIDCATDTVVSTIPVPESGYGFSHPSWDSVGNKLYVPIDRWDYPDKVTVYDCATDSLLTIIDVPSRPNVMNFYYPLHKAYYAPNDISGPAGVIDIERDSVVRLFPFGSAGPWNSVAIDTIDQKAYVLGSETLSYGTALYVVNCATDSVIKKLTFPHKPWHVDFMCWVPWSNRLYLTRRQASPYQNLGMYVVDCNTDSIIVSDLVLGYWPPFDFQIDPIHERVFAIGCESTSVHVLREVEGGVVEETPNTEVRTAKPIPTIVRSVLFLAESPSSSPSASCLLDVSGRKVLNLHPGANDVQSLAPGVYFIRQGLGTRGEGLGETRKIVLTE